MVGNLPLCLGFMVPVGMYRSSTHMTRVMGHTKAETGQKEGELASVAAGAIPPAIHSRPHQNLTRR
jgi:hypothetical protein